MSTGKKQKTHYCVLLGFLHSAGNPWVDSSLFQSCTKLLVDRKTGTSVWLVFLSQMLPWVIRGNRGEGRNRVSGFCFTPISPLASHSYI